METSLIIAFVVGIALGGIIGFLVKALNTKENRDQNAEKYRLELEMEQERAARQQGDIESLNQSLREEREKLMKESSEKATLQADFRNLQERLAEQKNEVAELQKQFALQFKNLANEIFEEKSKKFTDQNKTNLFDLLNPLKEKIEKFEEKVEKNSRESLQWNTALKSQLDQLKELNHQITKEAESLTKALKGDTKMQGNWGELILERILEQSGLEKEREYFTQESMNTEEGRRLRPDVIIRLPDNKNLVIDSKVSLVAYEKFANAETEVDREKYLKEHLVSLRGHIKGLSEKNYQSLFDGESLDYVLMFVPIESAFGLLVNEGGNIYNEAHEKNIIVVSPTTLIATLRTVANIWKHEYQNRNALEIARQGGALYDKFKSFVDDLIKVGQSIKTSQNTYEEAMKKLYSGKDNLIRKTERLRELGAKVSKNMDQKLLDRAEVNGSKEQERSKEEQPNLFGAK
mgnify:CR=1 FL=1